MLGQGVRSCGWSGSGCYYWSAPAYLPLLLLSHPIIMLYSHRTLCQWCTLEVRCTQAGVVQSQPGLTETYGQV